MKVWIEKTKVKGRKDRLQDDRALGKVIWSPTAGSDGRDTYKNMRLVKPGDFVIHFIDNNKFAGISVISSELQNVKGLENTQWDTDCYLFHLQDYEKFTLLRGKFLNEQNAAILKDIADHSEVFYQSDLNLRQGAYLTPCNKELIQLINETYKKDTGTDIPKYLNITGSSDFKRHFWLLSPGENGRKWEEFFSANIMAIGWDDLGDLSSYNSKDEIEKALLDGGIPGKRKYNDALACFEFVSTIKPGDIVIAKKGKKEYVGWGVVSGEYFFDDKQTEYKNRRTIDWKTKGEWTDDAGDIVTKTLTDITKYPDYVERLSKLIKIELSATASKNIYVEHPLNTILYGPPGTGKTYNTVLRAAEIIENRKMNSYDDALATFKANLHEQIEFITFHQNYSYEDFIQGLRPDTENDNQLTFYKKDGIFKVIADKALQNLKDSETPPVAKRIFEEVFNEFISPLVEGEVEEIKVEMKKVSYFITAVTNKSIDFRKASGGSAHTLSVGTLKKMYAAESVLDIQGLASYYSPLLVSLLRIGKDSSGKKAEIERKNYVIIIDEINRANISRVFGELITLIEPDKRSHGAIPMEAKLPSGDKFVVPSNLFIIGTMNTADKSIALLDIALRRRFEFEAMYPKLQIEGQEIYDVDILKKINEQIIKSKGHDFQIGHAYFMGENKDLIPRMNKKVIPLLLEYYMNDEKEVKGILQSSGLAIEENSWPLRITGKND